MGASYLFYLEIGAVDLVVCLSQLPELRDGSDGGQVFAFKLVRIFVVRPEADVEVFLYPGIGC